MFARFVARSSCSSTFDSPSTIAAALRCAALLELVAEVLQVAARDAAREVSGQAARAGPDDCAAEDRGWEQGPGQRSDCGPVQAPCWVEIEHGLVVGLGLSDLVLYGPYLHGW